MATISTKKLVYDFDRLFQGINGVKNEEMPLVDKVAYLNQAQSIWFENIVRVAGTSKELTEELAVFLVCDYEMKCSIKNEDCISCKFPDNFYSRQNQEVVACKESCCKGIEKRFPIQMVQLDDKRTSFRDTYRQADFRFEQILGVVGNKGITVYHQQEMEIKKVIADYYRSPSELHAPSLEICNDGAYYDYCGKKIVKDTNLEVTCKYSDVSIVDIAVLLANKTAGRLNDFQAQLQLILNKLKIT